MKFSMKGSCMRHLRFFCVFIFLSLNLAIAQDQESAEPVWNTQLKHIYYVITNIWDNGYFYDKVADNVPDKSRCGFTRDDLSWEEIPHLQDWSYFEKYDESLTVYVLDFYKYDGYRKKLIARLEGNGKVVYFPQDVFVEKNGLLKEVVDEIPRTVIKIDPEDFLKYQKDGGIFSEEWKWKEIEKNVKKIKFARKEEREEFLKKFSETRSLYEKEKNRYEEEYDEDDPFGPDSPRFVSLINRAAELQKISQEKSRRPKKQHVIDCAKNVTLS